MAKEVAEKVVHKTEVTAEGMSDLVVNSPRNVNKAAADEFVKLRDKKRAH